MFTWCRESFTDLMTRSTAARHSWIQGSIFCPKCRGDIRLTDFFLMQNIHHCLQFESSALRGGTCSEKIFQHQLIFGKSGLRIFRRTTIIPGYHTFVLVWEDRKRGAIGGPGLSDTWSWLDDSLPPEISSLWHFQCFDNT